MLNEEWQEWLCIWRLLIIFGMPDDLIWNWNPLNPSLTKLSAVETFQSSCCLNKEYCSNIEVLIYWKFILLNCSTTCTQSCIMLYVSSTKTRHWVSKPLGWDLQAVAEGNWTYYVLNDIQFMNLKFDFNKLSAVWLFSFWPIIFSQAS